MVDRLVRYSEIKKFKRCRRSWMNGYFLNLGLPEFTGDRAPSKSRDTGTVVHRDLEHYALHAGEGARPGDWLRSGAEGSVPPVSENFQKEWDEVFSLAQIMVDGYAEWLEETGAEQGERTAGTELEVLVPMGTFSGDEVTLVVHIDRLVFNETWDHYVIEDYKTVDQLGSPQQFASDEQLLTYCYAIQRDLNLPSPPEARHTKLRRVKRTARANPPFYAQDSITPTQTQIDNHVISLRGVLADLVSAQQALEADAAPNGVAYPNVTKDCSWDCTFLPICAMHDDGSDLDGVRATLYVKRDSLPQKEEGDQ